jgi:hypothetical protein
MNHKMIFLFVILIALGSGCYYDSFEALHPLDGYVNPCDTTLQSTYSSSIQLIISYNCISCHNSSYAGGNVVLDSYDQVKINCSNGKIPNAILRNSGYNPMPPTQALAACQTQRIQQWITNNYPQ